MSPALRRRLDIAICGAWIGCVILTVFAYGIALERAHTFDALARRLGW